jgi:hypothetical protein
MIPNIKLYLLFCFLGLTLNSYSQLYINEFCASNTSGITDPDYNSNADWIEIYNSGSTAVNLKGYFLTDNLDKPLKWKIPSVSLPAKGYITIWADGKDSSLHTNFKMDAAGEQIGLYDAEQNCIDSVSYSLQKPNISNGRNRNNIKQWGFFLAPTPGAANTSAFYTGIVLNSPQFKPLGGIFNSAQNVVLFDDLGGTVRYTLDGSEPTGSSSLYTSEIAISKNTVVRARVFKNGMVPGPVVTNSYFIDTAINNHKLPVVSLATDSVNFWDIQKGIYVQSFKPEWEVPVNIELFENNGSDRAAFNELSGMKINGLYSWQLPQKMLGVYFKKTYGNGSCDFPIFNNTPRSSFKTFALRASGNDWSNTLIRDILGAHSTLLNMKLDISAYRWCSVFINGRYLGIHNFREKIETDYIQKHYELEEGAFDMIEYETNVESGSIDAYKRFQELYLNDLSVQINYDSVAAYMDIEEFTDMVITEIATGNTSINHNVMAWKPKDSGKWKWILMDLDRGYYLSRISEKIVFLTYPNTIPFNNLMANSAYKAYFGKRLASHFYTSFNPQRMQKLITEHQQAIAPEIPQHVERWLGTTSSYGDAMPSVEYWYNQVAEVRRYVTERPEIILNDLQNYGFSTIAQLTLANVPEYGGDITFNTMKISDPCWTGLYVKDIASTIMAKEKAGYTFQGWVNTQKTDLVAKGDTWKYNDSGSDFGQTWIDSTFDDSAWRSGIAQFGYGETDQKTTINSNIVAFFRKNFNLSSVDLNVTNLVLYLLADDGAVVYLNGKEIARDNMPDFTIKYNTLAATSISGTFEGKYHIFSVDKSLLREGANVIAVEVHQDSNNSSDMSFDLELAAYSNDNKGYISTNPKLNFTLKSDSSVAAIYTPNGKCMVPEVISVNTTLHKDCSPYIVQSDVVIEKNATLTIEPGVEIWFSEGNNVFIHGNIKAVGTSSDSIKFMINPKYAGTSWGSLNFEYTTDTTVFKYVSIANASKGPIPIRVGAITGFYTNLVLDHIRIDNTDGNPIASRYSDVRLTNSYIHSKVTSDLINIKYGKGYIDHCEFHGNPQFDSDGIDYDGIVDGVIKNTKLIDILGYNADAIDIGEEATNVMIDSVLIFNAFDKGVSVGQRSSVVLTNSTLVNCNMGLGIKDSSWAYIDHCTFFGNFRNVSCYEKNPGRAGGNAEVKNSILSNSTDATVSADNKSKISISFSLSDNDTLPEGAGNKFGNPLFTDPLHFDLSLQGSSPCFSAANDTVNGGTLGSYVHTIDYEPEVYICRFFINALNEVLPEFIAIYNPTGHKVDVSNYSIDKGITATITQGTFIEAGDTLFITDNINHVSWWNNSRVVQWTEGKLSNNGENINLLNNYGIVIDRIRYTDNGSWPMAAFNDNAVFTLVNQNADNHFPENWTSIDVKKVLETPSIAANLMKVYPNPTRNMVTIETSDFNNQIVDLYDLMGVKLASLKLSSSRTQIDVSGFNKSMLFLRSEDKVFKIVVLKK